MPRLLQLPFVKYCGYRHHLNFNAFTINWPVLWQTMSPLFTHTVPLLCSRHWLPPKFNIVFKISLLTYKSLCEKLFILTQCLPHLSKTPPFTRSVPLLRSLHLLPVKFRVDFKICLLTYKTLNEKRPVYLHSLLATPLPSRSPRSHKGITSSVPRGKTNAGKRSFSSCCWALIWMSCHWAWLRRGYWRYRNLIDWLIDWLIFPMPFTEINWRNYSVGC